MENILDQAKEGNLDTDKSYVVYCMKGIQSRDVAYGLAYGYDAVSIRHGYSGGGLCLPLTVITAINRMRWSIRKGIS